MRGFAFALALSLLAAPAEAAPARAASLNLCTDELLLLLGGRRQIGSVTHLAQNPAETPLWRQARQYRRNDGSLASVAPLRPELVLTMGGGARDRAGIARRLGIRLLDLPYPQSLSDIAANVAAVAAALGRPEAAMPILQRLRQLERSAPAAGLDTIWLGGGGRTVAAGSLSAQWMRLAGLRQRPLTGDRVSLEELLVRPPALILRSDYRAGQYSSGQRWLSHPLVARARHSRILATDGRLWTCMGPLLAPEILRLRRELGR
ncbi:MAG: iron complex transport system substrate-binding protein [Sphingomonadales bacterium]|jgi:iron complex transport system substrate-binding protein|nr:iron complex transport system substrate-binding protein [Sphingomonadales bacterium]